LYEKTVLAKVTNRDIYRDPKEAERFFLPETGGDCLAFTDSILIVDSSALDLGYFYVTAYDPATDEIIVHSFARHEASGRTVREPFFSPALRLKEIEVKVLASMLRVLENPGAAVNFDSFLEIYRSPEEVHELTPKVMPADDRKGRPAIWVQPVGRRVIVADVPIVEENIVGLNITTGDPIAHIFRSTTDFFKPTNFSPSDGWMITGTSAHVPLFLRPGDSEKLAVFLEESWRRRKEQMHH